MTESNGMTTSNARLVLARAVVSGHLVAILGWDSEVVVDDLLASYIAERIDASSDRTPHGLQPIADLAEARFSRQDLVILVRDGMRRSYDRLAPIPSFLVRHRVKLIVDTRLDSRLEEAFKAAKVPFTTIYAGEDVSFASQRDTLIFKVRGSTDRPNSLALTTSDWRRTRSSLSKLFDSLRVLAAPCAFLVVGHAPGSVLAREVVAELLGDTPARSRSGVFASTDPADPEGDYWSRTWHFHHCSVDDLSAPFEFQDASASAHIDEEMRVVGTRALEVGEGAALVGREVDLERLTQHAVRYRIGVLHGSAGCGKTSLLRAGLVTTLAGFDMDVLYYDLRQGIPRDHRDVRSSREIVYVYDHVEEALTARTRQESASFISDLVTGARLGAPTPPRIVLSVEESYLAQLDYSTPDGLRLLNHGLPLGNLDIRSTVLARLLARLIGVSEQKIGPVAETLYGEGTGIQAWKLQLVAHYLHSGNPPVLSGDVVDAALSDHFLHLLRQRDLAETGAIRRLMRLVASRGAARVQWSELRRHGDLEEVARLLLDHRILLRRSLGDEDGVLLASDAYLAAFRRFYGEDLEVSVALGRLAEQSVEAFRRFSVLPSAEVVDLFVGAFDGASLQDSMAEVLIRADVASGRGAERWGHAGRRASTTIQSSLLDGVRQDRLDLADAILLAEVLDEYGVDELFHVVREVSLQDERSNPKLPRRGEKGWQALDVLVRADVEKSGGALRQLVPRGHVLVPGGVAIIGSDRFNDESPVHQRRVFSFFVGVFPVTVAEWNSAAVEEMYRDPRLPRVVRSHLMTRASVDLKRIQGEASVAAGGISWFEAFAFLGQFGARLPTEFEWEWAVRGPQARMFPWGDSMGDVACNIDGRGPNARSDVAAGAPENESWCGMREAIGNVWEWTLSLYRPYPGSEAEDRESLAIDGPRVLKGASYATAPPDCHASYRLRYPARGEFDYFGLRSTFPNWSPSWTR